MRYVKTPAEIQRRQAIYANPQFLNSRSLAISFETKPEIVKGILPPPLEPASEPIGNVAIFQIGGSNCVGPFWGASLTVRARYRDIAGNYCIAMPMSTDIAIIFGRELYGEPKKLARVTLERAGNQVTATVERYGITYIELRATLTEMVEPPPPRGEASTFHFKYLPSPDGKGFDSPPQLVHISGEGRTRRLERGSGEIIFRDSPHDPVADIEIVRVLGAAYSEGDSFLRGRILTSVDPEAFLPYAWGKTDDLELLARESAAALSR